MRWRSIQFICLFFFICTLHGCLPLKYQIRSYVAKDAWGPMITPTPVSIENGIISFKMQFEPGMKRLKKHHELKLDVVLESGREEQTLGSYSFTRVDFEQTFEVELSAPLNMALRNGKGVISIRGQKIKRNGKEMTMMGHVLCEVIN